LRGPPARHSFPTRRSSDLEVGLLLRGLVDLAALDGLALSCTVPPLVRAYEEFGEREGVSPLVLGPGTRTGIPLRYDDPREVGPEDRKSTRLNSSHEWSS